MAGRTGEQRRRRWEIHLRSDLKKGPWSKKEDAMLMEVVQEANNENREHGGWASIATHMSGRTGTQCRERWENHLQPDLKKG